MLNVSHQDDESESPRHAYREGESLSRSSSGGSWSRRSQPEPSENILVRATQDSASLNTTASAHPLKAVLTGSGEAQSPVEQFPERIEDSFEPPPPPMERTETQATQFAEPQIHGGPDEPPDITVQPEISDDEMYSISPDGKAKHEAAISAGKHVNTKVRYSS